MKTRVIGIACFLFALFAILIAHYFTIQIVQCAQWRAKAAKQHELVVTEPFRRGTLYGYVGQQPGQLVGERPLVFDVTKFHLYINPSVIPAAHREAIFKQLKECIPLEDQARGEFERQTQARCLIRWLSLEQKRAILSWWQPYAKRCKIPSNALYVLTDYQRSYPYGAFLGQTLHTIRDLKDEATAQALPTGGLESYFNELLKGKSGKRRLLRSPRNHLELDQLISIPEDGADIYLTINPFIQAIAEEELLKGVAAAQAKGGWAIMMEAKTGHILALAQAPAFDPSHYRDYFNDPARIEMTKVHAVTDAFELGSIMKPITVAIALQANRDLMKQGKPPLFDPVDKMSTTRSIFPGRASKPLQDPTHHRSLNMAMAIQKSSNIYMAELADRIVQKLGNDWYRNALVDMFAFGIPTGIELPAEAPGLVPSRTRCHPNGALEWSLPTPYSLAIGYNIMATGMQMLRAYAIFGNGGYLVQPTLVRKIVRRHFDGREEVVLDHMQRTVQRQTVDPTTVHAVLHAMKYTTKMGGTGRLAAVDGYTEAGKTGSAEKNVGGQYAHKTHLSSFIGIAPIYGDSPLVLLISIDEPAAVLQENGVKGYLGGRCAAPLFREIMSRSLKYLGVPEDDPYGYPVGDRRYDSAQADWVKEVCELKQLYEQWNSK